MEHGIEWIEWRSRRTDGGRTDVAKGRTNWHPVWANERTGRGSWQIDVLLSPSAPPLPRWGLLFSVELELRKRIFNWQVALNCTQGRVQGAKLQIIVYFSVSLSLLVYAVILGNSCYFRFPLIWLICVVDMQLLHIIEIIMDCTI